MCLLQQILFKVTFQTTGEDKFMLAEYVRIAIVLLSSIHVYLLKNLHITHHKAIRIDLDEKGHSTVTL